MHVILALFKALYRQNPNFTNKNAELHIFINNFGAKNLSVEKKITSMNLIHEHFRPNYSKIFFYFQWLLVRFWILFIRFFYFHCTFVLGFHKIFLITGIIFLQKIFKIIISIIRIASLFAHM